MAIKRISVPRFECTCELPDCPGKGKPWVTRSDKIPGRCRWCHRWTWNGVDRRVGRILTPEEREQNSQNAKRGWETRRKEEVA